MADKTVLKSSVIKELKWPIVSNLYELTVPDDEPEIPRLTSYRRGERRKNLPHKLVRWRVRAEHHRSER
jgi:hypothetical protein